LNERTFSFNFNVLDRYALKPAAKLWSLALPEEVRHGLANAFDNLAMAKRFVNKILQRREKSIADAVRDRERSW
jgi:phospholipid-binding lipoprotein MlaA